MYQSHLTQQDIQKGNTDLKYAAHTLPQNTSKKPIYAKQPQRNLSARDWYQYHKNLILTSIYITINVDCGSQCQTQDIQYRIDQKVKTLLQVKRHRIFVLLRAIKSYVFLCQLLKQVTKKISVILLETFFIWTQMLYSHTIGYQRTRPILDVLCLISQGSEFCHPLKCPDLVPPRSYIWVHLQDSIFTIQ